MPDAGACDVAALRLSAKPAPRGGPCAPAPQAASASMELDSAPPLAAAVRALEPVFVSSRNEYSSNYAAGEAATRPDGAPPIAFASLPLVIDRVAIGAVNFAFDHEHEF